MTTLAGRLEADGHNLSGVPGFFRDSNNSWTFVQAQRGILVPVRDMEGHIQGLQIRRDNVRSAGSPAPKERTDVSLRDGRIYPDLSDRLCCLQRVL